MTIRQTSLYAYKTASLAHDCQILYNAMVRLQQVHGDVTDMEIAVYLLWEKARVSARRNDLIREGVVKESIKRPSYTGGTNRIHQAWKVL